jgi:hypothetical protein
LQTIEALLALAARLNESEDGPHNQSSLSYYNCPLCGIAGDGKRRWPMVKA